MTLSKPLRLSLLLLFAWIALAVFATTHLASAQSSSQIISRERASLAVPGVIDGLNEAIAGGPGNFQSSAIGQVSHLIAAPFINPAASGLGYVASLKDNFALAPRAYAQDLSGYTGLLPIQPLWTLFRNLAYLGFVFMFIITGFMIMIRAKIDPRTVVSVQQAIPSIVIALILVTFSYAIVGFMIDLMNLSIALMVQIFVQQGILKQDSLTEPPIAQTTLFNKNVAELARAFWDGGIGAAADAVGQVVDELASSVFGGIAGKLAGFIGEGLMKLIFMIALLFAAIRTFIALLISYVTVIILTIVGPLQIMIGAIPGQGGNGFGKWFRNVAGNLAVFPVVAFLILLGAIITQVDNSNFGVDQTQLEPLGGKTLWRPPLLFGGVNNSDNIRALVGLGIVLMIPSASQMTKDLFKTGAFAYGAAIFSTIGAGAGVVTGPTGVARRATEEATREGGATILRKATGKVFGRSKGKTEGTES